MNTFNKNNQISIAERLFRTHLSYFTKPEMSREDYSKIFTEDAIQEFPYAPAPYAKTVTGIDAITDYITNVTKGATDWSFSKFNFFPTTDPNMIFVEFEGGALVTATGKRYQQIYVCRISIRGEQIASYREYWNPTSILEAFI